ncbi:uncharacterized protein LOC117318968 [Pecten maximus]|uniref:uncharacterized protein LOC117318968 n=1 Tax=Pecten maximus TaxID=6579 RepID=UPI001458F756|nr:uncharacterized protein LOC117318968 [Pecten maximus]
MKAYKSLDSYKYVVSGHVQVVISNPIADDCPFVALKAKVTPSQRARDKPHEPWVYLQKSSGTVYCAHCTCMAGLGEVCSHVGALLFKIEIGVKIGVTQTSSTSKACQWNTSFRKEIKPATITEIFDDIKGKRTREIQSVQANGSAPLPPKHDLQDLYSIVPNAAFFTCVTIADVNDNDSDMHQIEQNVTTKEKYPVLLTTISDSTSEESKKTLFEYVVTEAQCHNLEKATRNQAVSPLWYQHRMGRITASKAHDVLVRKDTTSPDNLVKRIMGYSTYDLSKKDSVRWGIENEDECRLLYTKHSAHQHIEFHCEESGFNINPKHPFLGASPDGIINCQCCGKGTLEIKCPFKHRNSTVQTAAATDKDFCLDSSLHLKTTHRYYTQVQFQMAICGYTYCDFVVYTKCKPAPSMVIVRVPIDINFCKNVVGKCELFMKKHVQQELITRQLESVISRATADTPLNNEDTWCLCSEPEYGRMIKCDSNDCPYQWFHYKCVNIRRKPRGKWFCTSCDS